MSTHKGQLAEIVPDVVSSEMIITEINLPASGGAGVEVFSLLDPAVVAALDQTEVVTMSAVAEEDWRIGDTDSTLFRKVLGSNVFNPPVRSWLNKFVASAAGAQTLTVEIFYNPYKTDFGAVNGLT